ncbi:MAG TPA: CRISPR-associated endoribonuclease Cas6 [Herpetosiphonaceae bacterium]
MPTALVLTLRPSAPATVAPYLGRAAHAAFLRALGARDQAFARRLHDSGALKPFATSDLLGASRGPQGRMVAPDRTYGMRWSAISPELDECLRDWAATPPTEFDLDGTLFRVEAATIDPVADSWAGTADWSELIALEQVGRAPPPAWFALHFVAPTTFRSNGRNIPLPLPELVFGSLVERWNGSAPIPLPADIRRFAAEHLVIGTYQLQSERVAAFEGGETAFTGRCTYVPTNHDRYYLHCCAALLRLAFFSGVGAKTSMGFGAVRGEAAPRRGSGPQP